MRINQAAIHYRVSTVEIIDFLNNNFNGGYSNIHKRLNSNELAFVHNSFYKKRLNALANIVYDSFLDSRPSLIVKHKLMFMYFNLDKVTEKHCFLSYSSELYTLLKIEINRDDYTLINYNDLIAKLLNLENLFLELTKELEIKSPESIFIEKLKHLLKCKIEGISLANNDIQNNFFQYDFNVLTAIAALKPKMINKKERVNEKAGNFIESLNFNKECSACQNYPCLCSDPEKSSTIASF